jgi:flagellar P-ring protein precursor FlgI
MRPLLVAILLAGQVAAGAVIATPVHAQDVAVRDLIIVDAAAPVRLMGYGLVTGLNGTGDRVTGLYGARHTVQSVVNLLKRFDIEVPAEVLRTRNVAAVLVTAEVSPYLHNGGRFEVHVSSIGDAQSLRGGVLWMTPLVTDAGERPAAAAQGAVIVSAGGTTRVSQTLSTTARIPDGGVVEGELPRPAATQGQRLLLREPDIGTATRIVAAIDSAFGKTGSATVEDPGAIALALTDSSGSAVAMTRIHELRVRPSRPARVIVDGRDGTVVAGGDMLVGDASVSHAGITLNIGASADTATVRGDVKLPTGSTVQKVASALHALRATPAETAAIFESLRAVGALAAEVVIR